MSPEKIYQMQEAMCSFCGHGHGAPAGAQSAQALQYVQMARSKVECRSLQNKLGECTAEERDVIFNSLYTKMLELVCDSSANYVIQKLCEVIGEEQQKRLLEFFLENYQYVIRQSNGCRVMQKFIETTSKENVEKLFLALRDVLVELSFSLNGNHIVQRFIECLPDHSAQIVQILRPHVSELVVDNCGCRVIQKLFGKMPIDQLRPIATEILQYAKDLAKNQYGNYVVQNILEAKQPEYVSALIKSFIGYFYEFSMHKFASNVIEKCIRGSTPEQQQVIFADIIGPSGNYNIERIKNLVCDQFGNYVIQRIIEFGTDSQKSIIYDVVSEFYYDYVHRNYSKPVITRLEDAGYKF